MKPYLLALTVAVLFACGCTEPRRPATNGGANAGALPKLEKVQLALNWFPESEHGGFYAARIHGYYAEVGLDVEIIPGGPQAPVVPQLARGDVEFGVANADNVLFGRAQEAPVVAVMTALQHSPRCILVHEETGIGSLEELPRLKELPEAKLAISPGAAFSVYLKAKVPLAEVAVVPYPGNVIQFVADKNFAQQGYNFSEPLLARRQGANVTVLMLSDIGFDPYTSLLVTHDTLIRDRPDIVRKMVAASVRGWQKYAAEPAETDQELLKLNQQLDAETLAEGADPLCKLVLGEGGPEKIGDMDAARWTRLAEQLQETGQLEDAAKAAAGAFTLEFLPGEQK